MALRRALHLRKPKPESESAVSSAHSRSLSSAVALTAFTFTVTATFAVALTRQPQETPPAAAAAVRLRGTRRAPPRGIETGTWNLRVPLERGTRECIGRFRFLVGLREGLREFARAAAAVGRSARRPPTRPPPPLVATIAVRQSGKCQRRPTRAARVADGQTEAPAGVLGPARG